MTSTAGAFADLALTTDNGGSLTVLIGNGDGSFQDPVVTTLSDTMRSLSIGDFNGDGSHLVAPGSVHTVQVYPGLGNGTFGPPTELEIGSQPRAAPSATSAAPFSILPC